MASTLPYHSLRAGSRFLIAVGILFFTIGLLYLASLFDEPPGFHPVVLGFLLLVAWAVWESIHQFLKRSSLGPFAKFSVAILVGTTCFNVLFYGFKWIDYSYYGSEPPLGLHMLVSTVIGLIVSTLFTSISLLHSSRRNSQQLALENERILRQQAQAHLSALQQQTDPHFLFNSFNTLYGLLEKDPQQGKVFLASLSDLYRYILETKDEQVISVSQEWSLVQKYLTLLKFRFGEALIVHLPANEALPHHRYVPPLAMQSLVENALKHNQVDKAAPLVLRFSFSTDYWTLRHNYQPKAPTDSTGTGLPNLRERLGFITDKPLLVEHSADHWQVSLPLGSIETS